MGRPVTRQRKQDVHHVRKFGALLCGAVAVVAPALAAEPDAGTLIERLQAGFSCPVSGATTAPGASGLHYVGDTRVFRVAMRKSTSAVGSASDDKYEIAFNFADIASVRTSGSQVVYSCRQPTGPSCIVRPRAETPSFVYEYSAPACDPRVASDLRDASEALMRLNAGVPVAGLPTIWEAPVKREAFWMHNESALNLVAQGNVRKFYYRTPSRLMTELGVSSGTLLFDGRRSGGEYSGTAYVFNRDCGAVGFAVSGFVSADDRQVTMRGRSPRRSRDCSVVDYRDDVLTFTLQDE